MYGIAKVYHLLSYWEGEPTLEKMPRIINFGSSDDIYCTQIRYTYLDTSESKSKGTGQSLLTNI